jgi:Family of unknown function (DUF6384)
MDSGTTGEASGTKVNATDEMGAGGDAAVLGGDMLSMDVADTLHRMPEFATSTDAVARLGAAYRSAGIEADERGIADGIAAYSDGRFSYTPPQTGIGVRLARLYVERKRWQPAVVAAILTLAIGFGGYYLVYKPYRISQAEQATADLQTLLPAQMDALYQTIFEETKIQQASVEAAELRARGKEAAQKGDREHAQAAIDSLTALRDTLRLDYSLRVLDGPDGKWGFWNFPADNSDAANYYLIVQAIDLNGQPLSLPIADEQTGRTETVTKWGLRVPIEVYRAVESDKQDNGVIEHALVGAKTFGFLDPEYAVDVLGGTVTRW